MSALPPTIIEIELEVSSDLTLQSVTITPILPEQPLPLNSPAPEGREA